MYRELAGELVKKDLTHEELAVKLRRSKSYVDKWFCGGNISLRDAYMVLDILKINHKELPRLFPNGG